MSSGGGLFSGTGARTTGTGGGLFGGTGTQPAGTTQPPKPTENPEEQKRKTEEKLRIFREKIDIKEKALTMSRELITLLIQSLNYSFASLPQKADLEKIFKSQELIDKIAKLCDFFQPFSQAEAEKFIKESTQAFYLLELGKDSPKFHEGLKAIGEAADVDLRTCTRYLQYSIYENKNLIVGLVKSYSPEKLNNYLPLVTANIVQEQADVLELISMMISTKHFESYSLKKEITDFLYELVNRHDLMTKLWKQFERLDDKPLPKMLKANPLRFYVSKMEQQFLILRCIYKGIATRLFQPNKEVFALMLDRFVQQGFRGSFKKDMEQAEEVRELEAYFQKTESVRHLSTLILIECLRIREIVKTPVDAFLSPSNRTFQLVFESMEKTVAAFTQLGEQDEYIFNKVFHFYCIYRSALCYLSQILNGYQSSRFPDAKNHFIKIQAQLDKMPTPFNTIQSGELVLELLESHLYGYLSASEKDLVKKTVKDYYSLLLQPAPFAGGEDPIVISEKSECKVLTEVLCKIVDSPSELVEFWQNFESETVFQGNFTVLFSRFLDIFPVNAEFTFEIAAQLIGEGGGDFPERVIGLFLNMRAFTYGKSREFGDSFKDQRTELLPTALKIPHMGGFEIPADTPFERTIEGKNKFLLDYNYWNIFWRMVTDLMNQSRKNDDIITLTPPVQIFLKVICRILQHQPTLAPLLQLAMLIPAESAQDFFEEDFRRQHEQGFSALILMLLEILRLLRRSSDNINLMLEIMRALNSLLSSDCCNEALIMIQVYDKLASDPEEQEQDYIIPSIIRLYDQKFFDPSPEPAYLMEELVRFAEIILLKSDCLFEYLPTDMFTKARAKLINLSDEGTYQRIDSYCRELFGADYWTEATATAFNRSQFELALALRPGSLNISTELVFEVLRQVVLPAIDIVKSNKVISFDQWLDIKFYIKARIFSILTHILTRFRAGSGLVLASLKFNSYQPVHSHEILVDFLENIDMVRYLLSVYDVEIADPEVFLGTRTESLLENSLGLENKEYFSDLKYSKNLQRASDAFQTCLIEAGRCFEASTELVLDFLRDSSAPASKLQFVKQFALATTNPEHFYLNTFNFQRFEYKVDFFLMILTLINFNSEKSLRNSELRPLHALDSAIDAHLLHSSLFCSSNELNYRVIFASKINKGLVLGSGRYGAIARNNSISSAAISALTSVLRVWRKSNRANKPVLFDILTSGKVSPAFAGKSLEWCHKILYGHISSLRFKSFEAIQALKFLNECLVSQNSFFTDFLKSCDGLKNSNVRHNGFVEVLKRNIEDLNDFGSTELFERDCLFECLCEMVQLVSNLYMRPSLRRDILSQLRPYVIVPLAKLISKIVEERYSYFARIVEEAMCLLKDRVKSWYALEVPNQRESAVLVRVRYAINLECNFLFSVRSFMKILNMDLFDNEKNKQAAPSSHAADSINSINSKVYLKIINYCLDQTKLHITDFLTEAKAMIENSLLGLNAQDRSQTLDLGLINDSENKICFKEPSLPAARDYRDPFFEEDWGNHFNEMDTLSKVRESNLEFSQGTTLLNYIHVYNLLNKTTIFMQMAVSEANKNLCFVTSNGLNGMILSTTLHQNPSYPTSQFAYNLFQMLVRNGLGTGKHEEKKELIEQLAATSNESTISSQEKKFFNPLYETKSEEWLGELYLPNQAKFADNAQNFQSLCEEILKHVSQMEDLLKETRPQSWGSYDHATDALHLELTGTICSVSVNHLASLAHVITNLYYGLRAEAHSTEGMAALVRSLTQGVCSFLASLNRNSPLKTEPTAKNRGHLSDILLCNYLGLFILSQFPKEAGAVIQLTERDFQVLTRSLKDLLKKEKSHVVMVVESFALLCRISPSKLDEGDLDVILDLLQDKALDPSAFKSICHFLIVCLGSPKTSGLVVNSKAISSLSNCKRFLQNPNFYQFTYYSDGCLDTEVSLWFWALSVVLHAYDATKEFVKTLDSILGFVKTYQNRILSVLSFEIVGLAQVYAENEAYSEDRRPRNESFRSAAFIQELDLVSSLACLLFADSAKWSNQNKPLFESLTFVLLSRTVVIVDRNQSVSELYIPYSWLEKTAQKVEIAYAQDRDQSARTRGVTPNRKPSTTAYPKMSFKKSDYFKQSVIRGGAVDGSGLGYGFNPELFSFKIELHLVKILFNVLNCLADAIDQVDLTYKSSGNWNYSQNGSVASARAGFGSPVNIKYDERFWREVPTHLLNIQEYLKSFLTQIDFNKDTYNKGILRLMMFESATESAIKSEMTNCIFPFFTVQEVYKMAQASLEMSILCVGLVQKQFQDVDRSVKVVCIEHMEGVKREVAKYLAFLGDRTGKATYGTQTAAKMSVNSANRSLEDCSEDRRFIEFLSIYFPQSS